MRTTSKMSMLIVGIALSTTLALAQDQKSSSQSQQGGQSGQSQQAELKKSTMKARADLEERIAQAHKNAADCLKSGKKTESDCNLQLSKECEATGASQQCMPKQTGSMAGQASMGQDAGQSNQP
jgi:hypothetical protein